MLRNPAFSAITVLTLALGIGATTAIFSVIYDIRERSLDAEPRPMFYASSRQRKVSSFSIVIHGGDPPTVIPSARRGVRCGWIR